jgi:hypothetical protein
MIVPRRGGKGSVTRLPPPLLIAVLVLVGCGIPSAGFIGPPGETDLQSPESLPVLTFDHNVDANATEDFKGYELYYRFYDNAAADTDYEEDRNEILALPVQPGTDLLTTNGYRRVVRATGDPSGTQVLPLIQVPSDEKSREFEVKLSFALVSPINPDEAAASWLGLQASLARSGAPDDSVEHEGFILGDYNGTEDEDLQQISRDIEQVIFEEQLYVALYGLGYGIDGLTFEEIYSEPVFLGYFRLQPDQ